MLLTQIVLNGVACIRFAVGAYRTEERHVDQAFDISQEEGHIAIKEWENERGLGSHSPDLLKCRKIRVF